MISLMWMTVGLSDDKTCKCFVFDVDHHLEKGTKDLIESTSQHCLVEDSNKSLIQQSYHSVTISV